MQQCNTWRGNKVLEKLLQLSCCHSIGTQWESFNVVGYLVFKKSMVSKQCHNVVFLDQLDSKHEKPQRVLALTLHLIHNRTVALANTQYNWRSNINSVTDADVSEVSEFFPNFDYIVDSEQLPVFSVHRIGIIIVTYIKGIQLNLADAHTRTSYTFVRCPDLQKEREKDFNLFNWPFVVLVT